MAEQYPWGAQSPQARLAKLQTALTSNDRARENYLETHKLKLAKFDECDRQTKSDIRQCQQVIDKERAETNATNLSRIMLRKFGSIDPAVVEEALKDGSLEERLSEVLTELNTRNGKKSGAKVSRPAGSEVQAESADASDDETGEG